MANKMGNHIISFLVACTIADGAYAQLNNNRSYVNPFIGTTKANVITKWGSEGGTYPGAVAPWGAVQLTPETRVQHSKGYDYTDSSLFFFSCIQHWSGFPNGSSGRLCVMPVQQANSFKFHKYNRRFRHSDEKAEPGYYSVLFRDNHTLVEATSGGHTGLFRFTFAPHVKPAVFIGDAGKLTSVSKNRLTGVDFNSIFHFNKNYVNRQDVDGGCILHFYTCCFRFNRHRAPHRYLYRQYSRC
jgi:putative alpha-1,2-mannosidase